MLAFFIYAIHAQQPTESPATQESSDAQTHPRSSQIPGSELPRTHQPFKETQEWVGVSKSKSNAPRGLFQSLAHRQHQGSLRQPVKMMALYKRANLGTKLPPKASRVLFFWVTGMWDQPQGFMAEKELVAP